MKTGRCRLCHQERQLCSSHIISEFFYTRCYDDKHRMHELDRTDGTVRYAQKGHREHLLCGDCEQRLNAFEDYVKEFWYDQDNLPKAPSSRDQIIHGVDYRRFKLCLLSILWRASVASQEFFENVSLGAKHEEALRQMLFNGDPGDESLYPFLCAVLWLPESEAGTWYIVRDATMAPLPKRYEHYHVYRFTFGGCMWDFLIGNYEPFGKITIRRDNTLRVGSQAFHQLREFRQFLQDHESAAKRRRAS